MRAPRWLLASQIPDGTLVYGPEQRSGTLYEVPCLRPPAVMNAELRARHPDYVVWLVDYAIPPVPPLGAVLAPAVDNTGFVRDDGSIGLPRRVLRALDLVPGSAVYFVVRQAPLEGGRPMIELLNSKAMQAFMASVDDPQNYNAWPVVVAPTPFAEELLGTALEQLPTETTT